VDRRSRRQTNEAATKVKAITNIVEAYQRTLREFKPAPPPPSSPLDKESRPQLQPRFQTREAPLQGRLIPTAAPTIAPIDPLKTPSGPVPAIKVEPKPVAVEAAAIPTVESLRPAPPPVAVAPPSPVSLILPRGVNPEVLEDVRRVDHCRKIFEETHQEIEVWEVFCLVMLDGEGTRALLEQTLLHKEKANSRGFMDGALALFDRLVKLRAQHGKFVRELRGYLAQLPSAPSARRRWRWRLGSSSRPAAAATAPSSGSRSPTATSRSRRPPRGRHQPHDELPDRPPDGSVSPRQNRRFFSRQSGRVQSSA
jgi:hypothetical protein